MIKANAAYMPLKDKSVQSIITSPPYWSLRKYDVPDMVWPDGWRGQLGLEPIPELYISHLMQAMAECWRVLKTDGICWINLGDTYAGSGGAGGDYCPGGLREGQPKYRQGKIMLKPKSLCLIPERFVIACQEAGWLVRNTIIWYKRNHMPSSVKDRFAVAHEKIFMLVKQGRYYFNLDSVRMPSNEPNNARPRMGQGKQTIYNQKRTKWGKVPDNRPTAFSRKGHSGYHDLNENPLCNPLGKNPGDVWDITTQPYPEAHYSTFPKKLVIRMMLCSTRPGDRVLDPFMGAATTAKVAIKLSRRPIGLDLGYHNLQKERLKKIQRTLLF